jgi:hypothetical protein
VKIRMLTTQRGAEDGVTLRTYEAGKEYDLSHSPGQLDLAAVFVREGWAEEVRAAAPPPAPESSAPEPAPPEAAPALAVAPVPPSRQDDRGAGRGRRGR